MIIGLYGCYCHPYQSWEELETFQKQKINIGDLVKTRCTGKSGIVMSIIEKKFVYVQEFGLDRFSNLIIVKKNETN